MISSIRINEDDWAYWLDQLAGQNELNGFECDAGLFQKKEFLAHLQRVGLNCRHVREVLPSDATEAYETARQTNCLADFYNGIYETMATAAREAQADFFSLPLRLDRLNEPAEEQMDALNEFLTQLLFAPLDRPYTLLFPVRIPAPFPTSLEAQRSLELCKRLLNAPQQYPTDLEGTAQNSRHTTMRNAKVGLLLHLYPEEGVLPSRAAEILLPCLPYIQAISFHYNIQAQETLFDDEQRAWADFLKKMEFTGTILFSPDSCSPRRAPEVLEHARLWATYYN